VEQLPDFSFSPEQKLCTRQVNPSLLPKLTKKGYSTIPSAVELSKMTEEQLSRVKDFTV